MIQILVADSGSTKTNWVLISENGVVAQVSTPGINPFVNSVAEIKAVIIEMQSAIRAYQKPAKIFFYGAGCSTKKNVDILTNCFLAAGFDPGLTFIFHDLTGAARALFENKEGIACILGTGSSSGFYDGRNIKIQIPALGYVLGDEGGGVDLGKRLLVAVVKKKAPAEIVDLFYDEYLLSHTEILDNIYFKPSPGRFIASFTPFLHKHLDHPFCQIIVKQSFQEFLELNVLQYEGCRNYTIGFNGSVAFAFQRILIERLDEAGLELEGIQEGPLKGLVAFHKQNLSYYPDSAVQPE